MQNTSANNAQSTTAPLSLLRLIAKDAEFRAKVESNPVAAFAEHGIHLESRPEKISLPNLNSLSGGKNDDDLADPKNLPPWMGLI